jgi:hypothetical protein
MRSQFRKAQYLFRSWLCQRPTQAVGIQQTLNDRDAAMQHAHYPCPPDVMQKIDDANKALVPTEKFAQQIEKIVNGELQADKNKQ